MQEIVETDFYLSCSEIERAGKSYLTININGAQYGSFGRVKNCQELASAQFGIAVVTIRKGQDVAFELKLDDTHVISAKVSKRSLAPVILVLLLFAPVFGLWLDQKRKQASTE